MYNDLYIKINASRIINDKTIENDSIRNTLYIIYRKMQTHKMSLTHSLSPPLSLSLSLCIQYAAALEILNLFIGLLLLCSKYDERKRRFLLSCTCNLFFSLSRNLEKCSPGLGDHPKNRGSLFSSSVLPSTFTLSFSLWTVSVSKVKLLTTRWTQTVNRN